MAPQILSHTTPLACLAALFKRTAKHTGLAGSQPLRMLQHAGDSDACGTFTPEDGGPTALVIGARAPTEALRRLAARHHIEPTALATFARGA